jgi:integrase
MQQYRLSRLKGQYCLVAWKDGKRIHRYRLGTRDKSEAERIAPSVWAELTRPKGTTVAELWNAFIAEYERRPIVGTMRYTWKALRLRFATRQAHTITVIDCREHMAERRQFGSKDGTLLTELGHLRIVLRWAQKRKLINEAPHIERPSKPRRKEHHLTKAQAQALIDAAEFPHIRLYIILALSTGARTGALLDLTWDRCDFKRRTIDLENPEINRPHKGRAIVPMTKTLETELLAARQGAMSKYVIEWAGEQVKSVKRSLHVTGKRARVGHVHPHLLRHSAAVHLAESGTPMEEIAQFLGHSDINVTRRIYARFSPDYLRKAVGALEYDSTGSARPVGKYAKRA